jgi:hydrogenase maturation protease
MKTLIFGAGNLLLSDEGFGVHCIRYLEEHYVFPPEVELYDGGTLGIMVSHKFEEADRVYLVDILDTDGDPGEVRRFDKEDVMLKRLPGKLSPHQIGIQEVLAICDIRGCAPAQLNVVAVVPGYLGAGAVLSSSVAASLPKVAALIAEELRAVGVCLSVRVQPK